MLSEQGIVIVLIVIVVIAVFIEEWRKDKKGDGK